MSDWIERIVIGAVFCGVLAIVTFAIIADEKEWEQYAAAHHCRQTGKIDSTTSTGFDTSGKMVVITTPSKIIYRCDGGETRIR